MDLSYRLPESRIIPASAGSTGQDVARASIDLDHPRVCGEHPGERLGAERVRRIIPASAGSTL